MWLITLRDLQSRLRQFGIAVVGAALVFALTLLLTGISEGFNTEARDTVAAAGADGWLVPEGVSGPFTSTSTLPADLADEVAGDEGVSAADPLVELGHVAEREDGESRNVNVLGVVPGGLGDPLDGGDGLASGEAVVDESLGAEVGETIRLGQSDFEVTQLVEGRTYYAGAPVIYVGLRDAQALAYEGEPLANSIVFQGTLDVPPPGFAVASNEQVEADLLEPLDGARSVISSVRLLMWIVAAVIIAAVVYLSALERVGDFAVLKAVGVSSRSLALGLVAQAVLTSLLAALLAAGIAALLEPLFPLPVTITGSAYVALPLLAVLIGALASLAALRRAVGVDPALAFG